MSSPYFPGDTKLAPAPRGSGYGTGSRGAGPAGGARAHFPAAIQLDGAGNGTTVIQPVSLGAAYLIERIVIPNVTSGTFEIFVGTDNDSGIADFTSALPNVADESSPIFVPPGQMVTLTITGGNANRLAFVNLQIQTS